MDFDQETRAGVEVRKRRLERILIGLTVLAIVGLTVLQTNLVRVGAGVPVFNSILVFAVININIILLFLLLFLVLRNLHRLFFESRGRALGARLWTKLIVAFVSLSLVPTTLLFFVAIQFITTSHDHWFSTNVEQPLVDAQALSRTVSELAERLTSDLGGTVAAEIVARKIYRPDQAAEAERFLLRQRNRYKLTWLEIYSIRRHPHASAYEPGPDGFSPALPPARAFNQAALTGQPQIWHDSPDGTLMVRVLWPLNSPSGELVGYLTAGYRLPDRYDKTLRAVNSGLEGYRQLKRLRDPIKISHLISLTIVALLIFFVSTWIGFHLARSITGPITDLLEGTERIAGGDYDFTIAVQSSDEIGSLVASFNRMTRDLKASKTELTRKNITLSQTITELDQRRRYMEIVLQNVAAGVISADANGTVATINRSASEILQIEPDQVLGRPLRDLRGPEPSTLLDELTRMARQSPRGSSEKQTRFKLGDQSFSLHVHLNLLRDENEQDVGWVIVFDDITGLEKAQRMAAWREVARRIAHEIKNPLTPIQLSTQRLRKRYGERFVEDGQVFDECTQTIIRQVDELKRLVNEFSNFARMPEVELAPNDLGEIVEETLSLYREGHKHVEFRIHRDPDLPVFNLDREQMQRVLINLLDNAVAAVEDGGLIGITLAYDKALKTARLEVADNGTGISPTDKSRLFEPYFSTKKSGTGLGLAIVSTIVADHNGFVRFLDNQPRGARFIIELPVRS
ncbi:MAG: HAMP domain-containing protein [Proteobacteria bacterium]|nr:HAMP domain-containing protein [Pseudomonadota bacterium]